MNIDDLLKKFDPNKASREEDYKKLIEAMPEDQAIQAFVTAVKDLDDIVTGLIVEFISLTNAFHTERLTAGLITSATLRQLSKKDIISKEDLAAELAEMKKDSVDSTEQHK
jgi:hypothetical protein